MNRIRPVADGSNPWRVNELAQARAASGEDVVLLSVGQEAEATTPEVVVEAAIDALRNGRHHYADVRGEQKLRDAIARYHTSLTGQSVDATQVTVTVGAQNALFSLAQVLLDTGDEALVVAPYYTTYPATLQASGASLRVHELRATDDYRLEVDALLANVTDRTRLMLLNAPSNPMGSCYTRDQLEAIIACCRDRGIWLVLDMVYADIVDRDACPLPHGITGADDVLISVGSLSKSHRMTGWRVGWAIGPPALAEHLADLNLCMHYGLPPFIMDAAVVAIDQAGDTASSVSAAVARRRAIARSMLTDIEPVRLIDSGHGMFILLDVRLLGITAEDFALQLLDVYKVAILPCQGFGDNGRYLARIGLCVDDQAMRRGCGAIRGLIEKLRGNAQF